MIAGKTLILSLLIPWGVQASPTPPAPDKKPASEARASEGHPKQSRKGVYLLKEIREIRDKKNNLSFYRIIFNKETGRRPAVAGKKQNKQDSPVWLKTYHVHAGLILGRTYDIQAFGKDRKEYFEAMQVLVFLKRKHGKSPVWMISKDKKGIDLRGSSFLKMHSPASDFIIF